MKINSSTRKKYAVVTRLAIVVCTCGVYDFYHY